MNFKNGWLTRVRLPLPIRYYSRNKGPQRTGFVLWIGRTSIRRDRHSTWSRWTVTRHRNPVDFDIQKD